MALPAPVGIQDATAAMTQYIDEHIQHQAQEQAGEKRRVSEKDLLDAVGQRLSLLSIATNDDLNPAARNFRPQPPGDPPPPVPSPMSSVPLVGSPTGPQDMPPDQPPGNYDARRSSWASIRTDGSEEQEDAPIGFPGAPAPPIRPPAMVGRGQRQHPDVPPGRYGDYSQAYAGLPSQEYWPPQPPQGAWDERRGSLDSIRTNEDEDAPPAFVGAPPMLARPQAAPRAPHPLARHGEYNQIANPGYGTSLSQVFSSQPVSSPNRHIDLAGAAEDQWMQQAVHRANASGVAAYSQALPLSPPRRSADGIWGEQARGTSKRGSLDSIVTNDELDYGDQMEAPFAGGRQQGGLRMPPQHPHGRPHHAGIDYAGSLSQSFPSQPGSPPSQPVDLSRGYGQGGAMNPMMQHMYPPVGGGSPLGGQTLPYQALQGPNTGWPPGYFGGGEAAGWGSPHGAAAGMQMAGGGSPYAGQAQAWAQSRPRTTVMLRNLPERFTRSMLTNLLDKEGFGAVYDFVYMPMNFRTKASFGYAFVNVVTPDEACRLCQQLQNFDRWGITTEKVCDVLWSDMHQGLAAHVERYRNSPVMHESVPDEYKPAMFVRGIRVAFPPPTKSLRMPRIRKGADFDFEDGDGPPGGAGQGQAQAV